MYFTHDIKSYKNLSLYTPYQNANTTVFNYNGQQSI